MFRATHNKCLALAFAISVFSSVSALTAPASGQELSQEMRDIFSDMLPELDSDLQSLVRDALKQNQDYLELTPDQFKRFRDHPANPFQGWQDIDPDSIGGLIRLQFETQPIRSRTPDQFERQAPDQLAAFIPLVAEASAATVSVTDGKVQIALGTIVTTDGHVLTKLSEIKDCEHLFCKTNDGTKFSAEIVAENDSNDVGILKLADAKNLLPVTFEEFQPRLGSFVLTVDGGPSPIAMGVYSNTVRSLIGDNQAFLGVKPGPASKGVEIIEVTAGSAAAQVGLRLGDILLALNGTPLNDVSDLVKEIRKNSPGDKVIVEYQREGSHGEVVATLAGRNVGGPTADRFKQMQTFGAIPSNRRDEFPMVFQHDTPILPEQCGGPVVDIRGRVIGVNIARGGRVASYAIPSRHLNTLIREMLRPNVASNPDID